MFHAYQYYLNQKERDIQNKRGSFTDHASKKYRPSTSNAYQSSNKRCISDISN